MISINEAQLEFLSATITRVGEGLLTGGVGLPFLMAESFAEYMLYVRTVTPPAKGARTVGSIDFSRGKFAIDVDLGRAFMVTARGAVMTLVGGQLVTRAASTAGRIAAGAVTSGAVRVGARVGKAVGQRVTRFAGRRAGVNVARGVSRQITTRAQQIARKTAEASVKQSAEMAAKGMGEAEAWYESKRGSGGRFRGTQRMTIDVGDFARLRAKKHALVGTLQAGWNAATERFGMRAPSWISSKRGSGRVMVKRSMSEYSVTAENTTDFAGGIEGMQSRLNYAARRVAANMEARASAIAERALKSAIT